MLALMNFTCLYNQQDIIIKLTTPCSHFRYNTTAKQPATPRSCASLDTEGMEMKQRQHNHHHGNEVKRQGSSQDGESIKIVIDDVDSTAAAIDNNKAQSNDAAEFRTRGTQNRYIMTDIYLL